MSRKHFYSFLLAILGFFIYFPSLFGGLLFDDEDLIYANAYVKTFAIGKFFTENSIAGRGKISNYYRPIQLILYALVYKIFGLSPFAYHLLNIIFHITASIFAFHYSFLNLCIALSYSSCYFSKISRYKKCLA